MVFRPALTGCRHDQLPARERRDQPAADFPPIDQSVEVRGGDCIRVMMHVVPKETIVSWTVEVWNEGNGSSSDRVRKAAFKHSTFKGMLLCEEDLQRTRPAFVPKLTPWGDARLSVLTLCDGKRPLSEIKQEVFRRHPKLFKSAAEAATFVAEVVTRTHSDPC